MSEILDRCLIGINNYDETIRVDAIPKARKSYVDTWKLSTEIEVEKIRHDIDFYIGFPIEFPYTRPDFYFQSSEFGYLPHVESDNGKLCLDEDGSVFNTENPVAIIQECVRRAKRLIKEGAAKTNFADFLKEIESYWTREYDGEPNTRDSIIFYGKWPSEDCELNILNYHVDQPEDTQKHFVINSLLYIGYNEPFDGYISKHFQHELRKALFINNVYIRETAPYNLTFEEFLSLLTEAGKKHALKFLNKYNGGDIYFKLTDNRIAGISFGKANLHMNGFRTLKPCYVYENFGNKKKNLQRLYGFVYTRERAAERTSGTLKTSMNFLVAGLGSIGSNLVHFLLGYNNTSFTLVDRDVLTVDNIGRHVLGFRYVNLSKVHGMADYIKASDIESNVKPIVSTLQEYVRGNFNKLNDFNAIFLCVGDVMTERYVYQSVIDAKVSVPIFNLWLEPFGIGGHMVYVNPAYKTNVVDIYETYMKGFAKGNEKGFFVSLPQITLKPYRYGDTEERSLL